MKSYIIRKKWIIIAIIICLIIIVVGSLMYIRYAPLFRGEFTPEAWDRHPTWRHRMIEDMENTIDIWNLSKEEIIDILGTNDAHIMSADYQSQSSIHYSIRSGRFGGHRYYIIIFSESGEVENIFTWGS